MNVLLVEDDQWMAELLSDIVEDFGWKLQLARSGEEAIDRIEDFRADVILADIILGGGSVIALLNELQSHSDLGKIPVVICSNSAREIPEKIWPHYNICGSLDKADMSPVSLRAALNRAVAGKTSRGDQA